MKEEPLALGDYFGTLNYSSWYRQKQTKSITHVALWFWGRKLSQILRFCVYTRKFSLRNLGRGIFLAQQKWAIHKSFLHKNRTFHQLAKVFYLESFPLYSTYLNIIFNNEPTHIVTGGYCFRRQTVVDSVSYTTGIIVKPTMYIFYTCLLITRRANQIGEYNR